MDVNQNQDNVFKYVPSKYQQDIFDFIKHGVGNIVVEACAGSGKTSTLIKCISLIPQYKHILFCAFNKEITNELKERIGDCANVDVKTLHKLGLDMLKRHLKCDDIVINENKYREYVSKNLSSLSDINTYDLSKRKYSKFINNICELIDYSRFNLYETEKEITNLISKHDIKIVADEVKVVKQALNWGQKKLDEIDYPDMVWLPNILYIKTYGLNYDYIFVDEAQDLSVVQRQLLLKCQRMGTRYAFFGDGNQSIYGFAGADVESFEALKKMPNTTSLPLSISYRCAENIVKFAKNYVSNIEPNESGEKGEVIWEGKLEDIKDGDMVLCRNSAPLIKVYKDLIKLGKVCHIKGKDIGLNLRHIIEHIDCNDLNVNLLNDGVFVRLYQELFENRNEEMSLTGLDEKTIINTSKIANKLDMIYALECLSDGLTTKQELLQKIDEVFSNNEKNGVMLSTVHQSKGLESNNVHILCHSLMPSKFATQDWEKKQEQNLKYVAITRAKQKLVLLSEYGFEHLLTNNGLTKLHQIEQKVMRTLNKKNKPNTINDKRTNVNVIKENVKIENLFPSNKIVLGEKKYNSNNNNSTIFKLNKKKLKKI